MTAITDVTQIPDYTQTEYNQCVEQAKTGQVDISLVDAALLQAVNSGKSFSEALSIVQSDLPKPAKPDLSLMVKLGNWTSLPAPGAVIMALITEISADQRQQNKEIMFAQTEAVVQSMMDEADKMREMALVQLVLGIVSAAVTIGGGIHQAKAAVTGDPTAAQAKGTAWGGCASIFNAASQFVGTQYQATFKELQADQEKMRAMRDSLKDINDGLKELIQRSLSSADSTQQSKNQAMTRILA